jgi:translation initiation factor 1
MSRDAETRLVWSSDAPAAAEAPVRGRKGRRRSAGSPPPVAAGRGIRLRLDRRASDRLVTVVTGLPGSDREVAELARALQAACGAGGPVQGGALELQGDHRDRVEAALAERGLRWKRSGG